MSSIGKDNEDTSSYMNNRIPRKKTVSSTLTNSSGSKTAAGIQSSTCTANQPAAAADILSLRIPRKSKDGAPSSNNKKRTHDTSSTSIATTAKTQKKVKTAATPQDNNNISTRE